MSRSRLGLLLAILLFVVSLVLVPARFVTWFLPAASLQATGFSGTLWRGRAAQATVTTAAGPFHLGTLRWRIFPWPLLSPRASIASAWGDQRLRATIGGWSAAQLKLQDMDVALPARLLTHLLPVALEGQVTAQIASLELAGALPQEARGRLVWENAAWNSPEGSIDLGSYAVDFTPLAAGAPGVQAEVLTLAGDVQVSGDLRLKDSDYTLDLAIGSARPLAPVLVNALSLIAAPVDGGFRLQLNGQLKSNSDSEQ